MIELKSYTMGFPGKTLVSDVEQAFGDGKLTALIGRNGAGKSTVLRSMAGLNDKYEGSIYIDGSEISAMTSNQRARHIAFVNTERTRIANLRCREVVGMGRAPFTDWIGNLSKHDEEIVERALRDIGMSEYSDRTLDTMSDGECQRVMIARALAQDTRNILLDEPTSFLDLPSRFELVRLLGELAHEQKKCVVFSTHELDLALRFSDMVALIADGTMYSKSAGEMRSGTFIEEKFGLSREMYG